MRLRETASESTLILMPGTCFRTLAQPCIEAVDVITSSMMSMCLPCRLWFGMSLNESITFANRWSAVSLVWLMV